MFRRMTELKVSRSPDRLDLSNPVAAPMVDAVQRRITYLRLSVTDRCDLRCTYCMPERMTFLPRKEVLSLEELYDLSRGFIARGVNKIRITGGEPLVRKDIVDLFNALGRQLVSRGGGGLKELTLTTNGTQLDRHADDLAKAGVERVNISLDTLDAAKFAELTLRDALPAGGHLAVSYNDATLEDSDYMAALTKAQDGATLVFEEYGDHLPGKGMKSRVYILRKA